MLGLNHSFPLRNLEDRTGDHPATIRLKRRKERDCDERTAYPKNESLLGWLLVVTTGIRTFAAITSSSWADWLLLTDWLRPQKNHQFFSLRCLPR